MKNNLSMLDIEKIWNLKAEAHNKIINYLRLKGLDEKELLKYSELQDEFTKYAFELKNCI